MGLRCRRLRILLLFSTWWMSFASIAVAQAVPDEMNTSYPSWESLPKELRDDFEAAYLASRSDSVFVLYFDTVGPVAMLDFIEGRTDRCHSSAHGLGSAIYSKLNDLGSSLAICGSRCTNACMHGVMRSAFGGHSFENVRSQATRICSAEMMDSDARPGACAHALGHAFMTSADYKVDDALSGCKEFTDRFDEYRCATGVFMEYRSMPMEVRARAAGSPWQYDCDSDPRYAVACYRYTIDVYLKLGVPDWDKEAGLCLERVGQSRLGCFHGLGIRYAGFVFKDPSQMSHYCRAGTRNDQLMCIEAMVENFAIHDRNKALETCRFVPTDLGADCRLAAEGGYYRSNKPTLDLYVPQE